jgi:hypothetical protein
MDAEFSFEAASSLQTHELANQLPDITEEEKRQLAESIKELGLLEPIALLGGKILDGKTRYRVCKEIGYDLGREDFEQFEEHHRDQDPALFVIAKNIHRRHLGVGQRAAVASELYKRVQKRKPGGYQPSALSGEGGHPVAHQAAPAADRRRSGIPDNDSPKASEQLAKVAAAAGVSVDAVQDAARIEKVAPELFKEVKSGTKTLHAATQEVATKTGRRAPRKPKQVMPLKDGLTLDQVFHMMVKERYQRLEGIVAGWGRVFFTLDTEIQINPGTRATESEVIEYCTSRGLLKSDGEWLFAKWEANRWTNNNTPIKDWKRTVIQWQLQGDIFPSHKRTPQRASPPHDHRAKLDVELALKNKKAAEAAKARMEDEQRSRNYVAIQRGRRARSDQQSLVRRRESGC